MNQLYTTSIHKNEINFILQLVIDILVFQESYNLIGL